MNKPALIALLLLTTSSALSAQNGKIAFKGITCDSLQYGVDNINKKLKEIKQEVILNSEEESIQFEMECEDSKDKIAMASLYTNLIPLCASSDKVYNQSFDFGHGAHLGFNIRTIHPLYNLLKDFGIEMTRKNRRGKSVSTYGRSGTGVGTTDHTLYSLRFPFCD